MARYYILVYNYSTSTAKPAYQCCLVKINLVRLISVIIRATISVDCPGKTILESEISVLLTDATYT